jgi:hypothetical protein
MKGILKREPIQRMVCLHCPLSAFLACKLLSFISLRARCNLTASSTCDMRVNKTCPVSVQALFFFLKTVESNFYIWKIKAENMQLHQCWIHVGAIL